MTRIGLSWGWLCLAACASGGALCACGDATSPAKPAPPAGKAPVPAAMPAPPAEWTAQISRYITEDQRQPQRVPGGRFALHAGSLDARLDSFGAEVSLGVDTGAGALRWRFDLAAPPAAPEIEGSRVVYRRAGGITEWYESRPNGIEQGFEVAEAPAAGDLVLAGAVDAPLEARPDADGFAWGDLRYAGVQAWDAAGRPLRGSIEWDGRVLAVRIPADELAEAEFPVTVDPLLTTAAWSYDPVTPSTPYPCHFGSSVASAGDVNNDGYDDVIVGVPIWTAEATNEGKAYVFHGGASGLASTPAWQLDPTNQLDANFGTSVTSVGDANGDGYADVVVGAPGETGVFPAQGRIHMYNGGPSGLSTSESWSTGNINQANARFGTVVLGAGDVNGDGTVDLVVSAPFWDIDAGDEGAVVFYANSGSGFAGATAYPSPTDQTGAAFGLSLAAAGDVNLDGRADIIAGAPLYDNGSDTDEGIVYVYVGSATVGLALHQTLTENVGPAGRFGSSVTGLTDYDGDGNADVAVGADGAATGAGALYLYLGTAAGIPATSTTSVTGAAGAKLGTALAAGDVNGDGYGDLLAGAPGFSGSVANEGAVQLYLGSEGGTLALTWTGEPVDQTGAAFGKALALAGDVNGDGFADMIVSAPDWDQASPINADEGRTYLFLGYAAGLQAAPGLEMDPTDQASARFGVSVAAAGDVNGDGYGDMIVGAPSWNGEASIEGRAYLFVGGANGVASTASWTADPTDQINAQFGLHVAAAGDVNGDGYGDVIVAAPLWGLPGANEDEGRVYVYQGTAGGLAAAPVWTQDPTDQSQAKYGAGIATAGDVNGDGFADIAIGAPEFDTPTYADGGRVWIYHGGASGPATTAATTLDVNLYNAFFGYAVAGVGDVNADGFADLGVGAIAVSNEASFEGRAFLFLGGSTGVATTAVWSADPADSYAAWFGAAMAGGDVNGDGFGDVLVGARNWSAGSPPEEGRAYLYLGQTGGLAATPIWTSEHPLNLGQNNFSNAVAVANVNGDRFDDLAVGTLGEYSRVYLFAGGASGPATTASWSTVSSLSYGSNAGALSAGDVNGDGFGDLMVGLDGWDTISPPINNEGRVQVFYGGDGASGRPRQLRQLEADGVTPLAAGNASATSGVQLEGLAFQESPAGGQVRVQFQVTRFANPPVTTIYSSGPVITGSPATYSLSGLTPGAYRWRARIVSQLGARGRWVAFGGNTESEVDFRILGVVGSSCAVNAQCQNNSCSDGVCCGTACGLGDPNDCQQCNASGTCVILTGTTCRAATGACDLAELCPGGTSACPADALAPSTTVCRAALDPACDVAETCTGTATACPAETGHAANGAACTDSTADCWDARCSSGVCSQIYTAEASGFVCRASAGVCDPQETCSGSGGSCPANSFSPSSTQCRAAIDASCDAAENCTGSAAACPGETGHAAAGAACPDTNAGDCQNAACAGDGTCNQSYSFEAAAYLCRPSVGACDIAESCTGTSGTCPADSAVLGGSTCRPSAGPCDPAETCSGTPGPCPADALSPASVVCRAALHPDCDAPEACTGSSAACPAETGHVSAGTNCADTTPGDCLDARCDGAGDCNQGALFEGVTYVCRSVAGVCDVAESCSGASATCPANAFDTGSECRAAGPGTCNPADLCDGTMPDCPADVDYDPDLDLVCAAEDNCPDDPNPAPQIDTDGDGQGDICDDDDDDDGLADAAEGPAGTDPLDPDTDGDTILDGDEVLGVGPACADDGDSDGPALDDDADGDGVLDSVEAGDGDLGTVPIDSDGDSCPDYRDLDSDFDGVGDVIDNCRLVPNPGQTDANMNGVGDACEGDKDGDGVPDATDNCPTVDNPGQEDADGDMIGDACDADTPDAGGWDAAVDAALPGDAGGDDASPDAAGGADAGQSEPRIGAYSCDCRAGAQGSPTGGGLLAGLLLVIAWVATAGGRRLRRRRRTG